MTRPSAEATPSQVWWLCSQHQPRCGALSEIHSAGTRRSVPREAPVWKHLFFSSASGTACRKASPSSMVSMRPAAVRDADRGLGRPDAAELLAALDPHHGVHGAVRDLHHGGEGVDVREVPAQRALPVAQPEHRHALGDREHGRPGTSTNDARAGSATTSSSSSARSGPARALAPARTCSG